MLLHTLLMCHDVFWDTGREPMQNNTHSLMKERCNLNTCCALLMCYLPEQDRMHNTGCCRGGYDIQSCSDGVGKHNEQNATAQSSIMIVHSDSTNISNDKKCSARATSSMAGQPPWKQGVPTTSCVCSFLLSTHGMDEPVLVHMTHS